MVSQSPSHSLFCVEGQAFRMEGSATSDRSAGQTGTRGDEACLFLVLVPHGGFPARVPSSLRNHYVDPIPQLTHNSQHVIFINVPCICFAKLFSQVVFVFTNREHPLDKPMKLQGKISRLSPPVTGGQGQCLWNLFREGRVTRTQGRGKYFGEELLDHNILFLV